MSASGRDPTGPTLLEVLFFEKNCSLKAPSWLLGVLVDFVVHGKFGESRVTSGDCTASRRLFCLKKFFSRCLFIMVFFFVAVFDLTELAFLSVFVPSGDQDIVLKKLIIRSICVLESVVRYSLSLAFILPIVFGCFWLFRDIVLLSIFCYQLCWGYCF